MSLDQHRRAVSFCAFCPKLCRFSCPVSNADLKEPHTPWGKMTTAFSHLTGGRPLDAQTGEALHACTGCLRCKTHCRHGNEVGPALFEARGEAVLCGSAPDGVAKVRARFSSDGPLEVALPVQVASFGTAGNPPEGRPYFPGCTALVKSPELVRSALDASAALGMRLSVSPAAGRCCGYPLWAAGLREEFAEHARAMERETAKLGELVVGDPGCAYTMLKGYKTAGVTLKVRVVLLVDLLAERLESAVGRAPLPMSVSYHDACLLGRGLGRYETPRRLLQATVGTFAEAAESRADGGCSGGGGLLPLTLPETAKEVALAQAEELSAPSRQVVTACPSARRMFEKAGVPAHDLFTILSRWITGEAKS